MKVNFLVIYILKFLGEKKIVNFSFENENYIKRILDMYGFGLIEFLLIINLD